MSLNPLVVLRKEAPLQRISFLDEHGNVANNSESLKYIKIGDFLFLRSAETSLKSKRGSGTYYMLDAVAFFFSRPEIKDMPYTEYLQLARKSGYGTVSLVDKKDLISYVLDGVDDVNSIDPSHPAVSVFSSIQEAENFVQMPDAKKDMNLIVDEPLFVKTRPVVSRIDIFHSSKDFTNVLQLYNETMKKIDKSNGQSAPISLVESIKKANTQINSTQGKDSSWVPIIIVPAAPTALITMFNVRDFLQNSAFIPTSEIKKKTSSSKESSIVVERSDSRDLQRSYQIIDNPSRLSLEDWNRVAAVFVQGPAWQFKGWKWENPVDVFQNGICIHFSVELIFSLRILSSL